VLLSSFDPVRREIARVALNKLILDGRIHPARIEKIVSKAKDEVELRSASRRERSRGWRAGLHPKSSSCWVA